MDEMDMETDQMNLMQQMSQMNISPSLPPLSNNQEQDISTVTSAVTDMSVGQVCKHTN
jgi:hypothetical protein